MGPGVVHRLPLPGRSTGPWAPVGHPATARDDGRVRVAARIFPDAPTRRSPRGDRCDRDHRRAWLVRVLRRPRRREGERVQRAVGYHDRPSGGGVRSSDRGRERGRLVEEGRGLWDRLRDHVRSVVGPHQADARLPPRERRHDALGTGVLRPGDGRCRRVHLEQVSLWTGRLAPHRATGGSYPAFFMEPYHCYDRSPRLSRRSGRLLARRRTAEVVLARTPPSTPDFCDRFLATHEAAALRASSACLVRFLAQGRAGPGAAARPVPAHASASPGDVSTDAQERSRRPVPRSPQARPLVDAVLRHFFDLPSCTPKTWPTCRLRGLRDAHGESRRFALAASRHRRALRPLSASQCGAGPREHGGGRALPRRSGFAG